MNSERINKFIGANSSFSRRKVDELILAGKVIVNSEKVTQPGIRINPEKDQISILGKKINILKKRAYIILHKPRGYICTRSDEKNRPTIMSLIPQITNLKPAGRLDMDSEGLIFISNDGNFIQKIIHPKFSCEKEYEVQVKGELNDNLKSRLEKGLKINGQKKTAPAKVKIIKRYPEKSLFTIILREGRNRQIRRMCEVIKRPVISLKRIRIGKIWLKNIESGKFRYLTKSEIESF